LCEKSQFLYIGKKDDSLFFFGCGKGCQFVDDAGFPDHSIIIADLVNHRVMGQK
jgi:hypothetical protein